MPITSLDIRHAEHMVTALRQHRQIVEGVRLCRKICIQMEDPENHTDVMNDDKAQLQLLDAIDKLLEL